MGRKKGTSMVELAIARVVGFAELWHLVERKITLSGQSPKTLTCYGRSLAQMALHFGRSPVRVHTFISDAPAGAYSTAALAAPFPPFPLDGH